MVPLVKVWENIILGDEPSRFRLSKSEGRRVARRVLDELGLDIGVDEHTFMLDPGEQRLVMFARTFHRTARLMIADEPTAGLGEKESRTVLDALLRLNAKGVTILFVSHHLSDVIEICDSVTAMRDGRVSAELAGADITEPRLIKELTGTNAVARAPGAVQRQSKIIVEGRHLAMPPLRQLNFKLHQNERLGFAGLLGSGRENAINVISGAARLWGSVRVKGEFIDNPREFDCQWARHPHRKSPTLHRSRLEPGQACQPAGAEFVEPVWFHPAGTRTRGGQARAGATESDGGTGSRTG